MLRRAVPAGVLGREQLRGPGSRPVGGQQLAGQLGVEEGKAAPGVHQVIVVIEHPAPAPLQRRPGSAKGRLIVLTEDDEHLQAFETHMP